MLKKRNLLFLSLLILGVFLITGCWLIPTPTYTVTFDSQGGSYVDPQTVEHGGLAIEPADPTKTGYTFAGWYKESGCTNAWNFATDTVTFDVTLYAKWIINSYTVTFNKNDDAVTGTMADQTIAYGSSANLTACEFSKTGWDFAGWAETSDGDVAYADQVIYTIGTENVTLYAQWTPPTTYSLRDIGPAGGWIFYDKGSYSGSPSWRYLEAAPASTECSAVWGSYGTPIGGTKAGIGTGKSNTAIIVAWLNDNSETGKAAQLCDALEVVNNTVTYSDWFLPSKDELNLMYTNLDVEGVGDFTLGFYWSSSEIVEYAAWVLEFKTSYFESNASKESSRRVRAVRSF